MCALWWSGCSESLVARFVIGVALSCVCAPFVRAPRLTSPSGKLVMISDSIEVKEAWIRDIGACISAL